jgi:3-methyl-2-oxobutanoate hydroxymethyltransferase
VRRGRAEHNSKEKQMSTTAPIQSPPVTDQLPVTLPALAARKERGEAIVMVTAYDYPSAQIAQEAGVDIVLVGDSAAMTVLGYPSTVPVSIEEMLMLTAAVRRGLRTPLLVADLPFGAYESSDEQAISSAQRFIKEGGAHAVKIEGGGRSVERARAIVEAGVPVMGHLGLTPQSATALGGYRAQGRTAERALALARDALALARAGVFAIVFEAIPAAVAAQIVPLLQIPVIGIGAGPATDGQVLVFHDLLGIYDGHAPRFAKRYASLRAQMVSALSSYAEEVRTRAFPAPEHTYSIDPTELEQLRAALARKAHEKPPGASEFAQRPA